MQFETTGNSYTAKCDDAGIINCHFPHAYRALEDDTVFVWAHFDGNNTRQFYEQILQRRQTAVFPVEKESCVRKNLDAFLAMHRRTEALADIRIEPEVSVLLHQILCELLFITEEDTKHTNLRNRTIEKALWYMRQNYCSPIEVKDIADMVSLSPYHFSRIFKQEVGCSPHEFIVILRINQAKLLLKTTELSIAQIALELGYEYPTSFVSAFSKRVGMTPKKFRDTPI